MNIQEENFLQFYEKSVNVLIIFSRENNLVFVKKENCVIMSLCNYHVKGSLLSSREQYWKTPSSDYSSQQPCKANTENPIIILFCKWTNTCISKETHTCLPGVMQ